MKLKVSPQNRQIGKAVRAARLSKGWTLRRLGQEMGYSRSYLSQVENGYNSLSVPGLLSLIKILKLDVSDALGLTVWKTCRHCSGTGKVSLT